MLNVAETNVGESVEAGSDLTGIGLDVTFNSGIEITMEGDLIVVADRIARVTLMTQSADSSGRAIGVCPTFAISSEFSSIKMGPVEETRRGCEAGAEGWTSCTEPESVTKYAGL